MWMFCWAGDVRRRVGGPMLGGNAFPTRSRRPTDSRSRGRHWYSDDCHASLDAVVRRLCAPAGIPRDREVGSAHGSPHRATLSSDPDARCGMRLAPSGPRGARPDDRTPARVRNSNNSTSPFCCLILGLTGGNGSKRDLPRGCEKTSAGSAGSVAIRCPALLLVNQSGQGHGSP